MESDLRIHIITHNWKNDHILSRQAKLLVEPLNATISNTYNNKADLQYLIPYYEYYGNDKNLPFIAYFTHKEDNNQIKKLKTWEFQAKKAKVRITNSLIYYDELLSYGETFKLLPHLDLDMFYLKSFKNKTRNKDKITIGVSGYVYPGGRKGEYLLKQLLNHDISRKINWVASGKGWGVPTTQYDFDQLQNFFHNIDFLLCTSLIEGIPYPPLEALACGTPVIIPKGVGILDELPAIKGIIKYNCNDFDDLLKTIKSVCNIEYNYNSVNLRSVVLPFNQYTWINGHQLIFQWIKENKII